MQRLSSMILFSLMFLLLITGCASVNEQAVSDSPESAATGDNGATTELANSTDGAAIAPLDAPTEDFNLIGITGRPQLLNSYADW